MGAINQQQFTIVSFLLDSCADPVGLPEALQIAPYEIVEELVRAHADPFERDDHGNTCMDIVMARDNKRDKLVAMLKELEAETERRLRELELEEQARRQA